MVFYKEKNFTFKLASQEGKEAFAIWKAWDYKDKQFQDSKTGQLIRFPIRSGQLVGTDGIARDVQTQIKFMPAGEFKGKYPYYSKRTTYIWDCIIDGQQYGVRFTKTSHRALLEKINTCYAMGINPFSQLYYQKFDKSKQAAQMYEVGIAQNAQQQAHAQGQVAGTSSDTTPQGYPQQSSPSHISSQLDKREQQIVEAIINKYGKGKISSQKFVELCKKNGVDSQRAQELFVNEYE